MEKKQKKRANDLTGSEWLKNSFTIWRDIKKTKEEKQLKHPAMFPAMLAEKLIECYTKEINNNKKRSLVLDPFSGIGTTVIAATQKNRNSIGIELSKEFVKISKKRLNDIQAQTTLDKSKKAKIKPTIINDKAENILKHVKSNTIDFCVTSPPYWDILNQKRTVDSKETKNYGASKSDLGNISDYDDFLNGLKVIFTDVFDVLKSGTRCAVVVMDIRKKSKFYPLHIDLTSKMQKIGFELDEFVIWDRQHEYNFMTTLGYPSVFRFNKVHEFICIYKKPD